MADQITQPLERTVQLGGKPYIVRELTLRNAMEMGSVFQRFASPTSVPTIQSVGFLRRAWLWITRQSVSRYGSIPEDLTKALQLAGADVTLDIVLNARPTEVSEALGTIVTMNDFAGQARKKVTAPVETGP